MPVSQPGHTNADQAQSPLNGLLYATPFNKLNKNIILHSIPFQLLLLCAVLLPSYLQAQDSTYQQAYAQYQNKQFDSAINQFNQFIFDNPEKKEGYYNRGLCYYYMDSLVAAQQDFNICLQADSVFDDARFMLALTLQRRGQWKKAEFEFNKLNTSYAGYNELKKRIYYHNVSVSISKYWYYMVAIMFMFIILVAVAAKSYSVKRGW